MHDKKTVYLHIGWEKTGTSAIQSFLGRNQSWLRHQGFRYPIMGNVPQHLVMYNALSSSRPRRIAKTVASIRELVRSTKEPSIIFSHERLHDCNPAMFRDIFKEEDVRIIAYLRRYDYSVISYFSTIIRWGMFSINPRSTLFRRFKEEHLRYFDYYWPLSNFACVFGKESLILRKYGKEDLIGGNSVQDFMCLLGINDLDGSLWPEARSNMSLNMDQLEFIFELAPQFRAIGSEEARQATRRICDILLSKTREDASNSVWKFTSNRIKQRILDSPRTQRCCLADSSTV